ncbi:hypothetical protein IC582_005349 [Cucumis melo]
MKKLRRNKVIEIINIPIIRVNIRISVRVCSCRAIQSNMCHMLHICWISNLHFHFLYFFIFSQN